MFGLRFGFVKLLLVICLGVILLVIEVKMMGVLVVFLVISVLLWVMSRVVVFVFVFVFVLIIVFG